MRGVFLATVMPTAAPQCTAAFTPQGCSNYAELGPQAQWLAVTAIELTMALIGAIVALAVVVAFTTLIRRAS